MEHHLVVPVNLVFILVMTLLYSTCFNPCMFFPPRFPLVFFAIAVVVVLSCPPTTVLWRLVNNSSLHCHENELALYFF
jgi:uncharacterized membrane protein